MKKKVLVMILLAGVLAGSSMTAQAAPLKGAATQICTASVVKVENVDVVARKVDEQWIIRLGDAAGVPDCVATVNELAVAGGHETIIITSTQKVRVAILTLGGALVASPEVDGTTRVSVAPGFYIVRSDTTSRKVAVW